jgi:hypothetical protein
VAAPSGYIRFFATTDDSTIGRAALGYVKALHRIAPVRLISISGGLVIGGWRGVAALLGTPMDGPMLLNAWCCDRSRWTWVQKAAIPRHGMPPEVIDQRMSLWTTGVRNAAFVLTPPKSKDEREVLERCDAIVVPSDSQVTDLLSQAPSLIVSDIGVDMQVHKVWPIDPESPEPLHMRKVIYG